MTKKPNTCHACYNSFSGWWCDNCDQWPCRCVPQEGDDAPEEAPVREEAVSVAGGGAGGSAPDAGDAAGVHGVPVRQAQEADVAPEQEAARVETCEVCGKPGIQGQPFSGGREYFCPSCNEVYSYPDAAPEATRIGVRGCCAECVIKELERANASGAVVAHRPDENLDENLDDTVNEMIAAGWTLGETVYVGGKRIRYLTRPEVSGEGQQAHGEADS